MRRLLGPLLGIAALAACGHAQVAAPPPRPLTTSTAATPEVKEGAGRAGQGGAIDADTQAAIDRGRRAGPGRRPRRRPEDLPGRRRPEPQRRPGLGEPGSHRRAEGRPEGGGGELPPRSAVHPGSARVVGLHRPAAGAHEARGRGRAAPPGRRPATAGRPRGPERAHLGAAGDKAAPRGRGRVEEDPQGRRAERAGDAAPRPGLLPPGQVRALPPRAGERASRGPEGPGDPQRAGHGPPQAEAATRRPGLVQDRRLAPPGLRRGPQQLRRDAGRQRGLRRRGEGAGAGGERRARAAPRADEPGQRLPGQARAREGEGAVREG